MNVGSRIGRIERDLDARPRPRSAITSWREWLAKHFGHIFTSPLASFHEEFMTWLFKSLCARRDGLPFPSGNAFFSIWGRGHAKSTFSEIAAILAAAMNPGMLVHYVSGTQSLARMHLYNIAELLSSPEIIAGYPELSEPKRSRITGVTAGYSQDVLMLKNGSVIEAFGLDVATRGSKRGTERPGLIILDDIDDGADGIAVAEKKLQVLTRKIIPGGTDRTLLICAQNLVHRNGVINRIFEGKVPALLNRVVSGPHPVVIGLQTEYRNGRDVIVAGRPSWGHFGLDSCQAMIDNSGLSAFLIECQHQLEEADADLVLPDWNEEVHIIGWTHFQAMFNHSRIPPDWKIYIANDWGASGPDKHANATVFVAVPPPWSVLPNIPFVFAEHIAEKLAIVDDVAGAINAILDRHGYSIRKETLPLGSVIWRGADDIKWIMSPTETAAIQTFNRHYGMKFKPAGKESIGKTGGLAQLGHYLKVDYNLRHPLKPGVMGASGMYVVVADDQIRAARDSAGMKRMRDEIADWRYRKVQMTDSGLQEERPIKRHDDMMDALRMVFGTFKPEPIPLANEDVYARIAENIAAGKYATLVDGYGASYSPRPGQQRSEGGVHNWRKEFVGNEDPLEDFAKQPARPDPPPDNPATMFPRRSQPSNWGHTDGYWRE